MAKKSRTPAPPRPVQAPRRRTTAPTTVAGAARQRLILYAVAGSGVVALAIVIGVLLALRGGGGGADVKRASKALAAAGCTFNSYPQQRRDHVALNYKFDYNSFPPTSGPHYYQWVIWGNYDQPVRQIQAIHNLEHGGIVIQYGSKVPRATVDKINAFYQSDPNGMLVAPLPALGEKIALEAWTHLGTCTTYNEHAFTKFRDALRYHGKERYPKSALQPGQ